LPELLFVPGPTLPELEGALEPVPAPVVPSLRIVPLPALVPLMPAVPELLVVGELLVGPLSEPALPWLDWANAPPADRAKMQADVRTIFFIVISLGFEATLQPSSSNSVPAQLDTVTKIVRERQVRSIKVTAYLGGS
jgi:hypothetical protein